MTTDEDDTEPLLVPGAERGSASRDAQPGEPNPGLGSPKDQWHKRTYEFASAEAALLYVTVVVALALSAGWWPRVELVARRVRLARLPGPGRGGEGGPPVEPEWSGWAVRLGGSEVVEGAGRWTPPEPS
jgi:hypothetical protein